jgi:hypothetical protein
VSAAEAAPANAINRLLGGPFGAFILKPWYDPVALQGVVKFFMPASRAWAAANASGGEIGAYLAALGQNRAVGLGLSRAIAETQTRAAAYRKAETEWQDAALNAAEPARIVALEDARMQAADAWMRARTTFVPSHLLNAFPAVKFEIEGQDELERRHGARLSDPKLMFPGADDVSGFAASPRCDVHGRNLSWVRFPSAPHSHDDHGWARVEEPREGGIKGVVVFCHGIMMEREHWASLYDQAEVFLEPEGGRLAVISPEGPGHGRRMMKGFYGGEPILAKGVGGIADYFAAHVVEVGRLIAWARRRYQCPVAVAGVSLGALTAQLVVSAAIQWPAESRPDAALLLTTNESLIDVTYNGSLAGGLGFPAALSAAGWTAERIERYRLLVEPGEAAVPPDKIVCVLGTTDTVTPYGGGERLAGRWRIPTSNVFRWHGGHFAAAFSVLRDRAPIHRFKAALAQA